MDASLIFPLLFVFILIVFSAFFSGSETGLTAVSKAKIHKLKISGDKRAAMVHKLRKNKDSLIGTILLGNNAVNILASALATSFAIKIYGQQGVVYVTIVMTLLVLIFAEVLPKTYAFYNAEKIALKVAPTLTIFVKIFSPFTNAIQKIVDALMVIMGVTKKSDEALSIEELKGAIDLHHHEGGVVKRDRYMLRSILDLAEMEVKDVMVHRKNIISLDIDQPTEEIVTNILDNQYSRIPLWQEKPDNIVGVLHVKALLKSLRLFDGEIAELNIMEIAAKPWFVPETNSLSNQLFQFREKRNHISIVVDEYGALVGLVTLEDVLEEIVGHIEDEHDDVVKGIKKLKNGSYRMNGDVTIRDINRQLDWNLPDENATTIAGLVIHEAESIPDEKAVFTFYNFEFIVEKKKDNQITSLIVRKI